MSWLFDKQQRKFVLIVIAVGLIVIAIVVYNAWQDLQPTLEWLKPIRQK